MSRPSNPSSHFPRLRTVSAVLVAAGIATMTVVGIGAASATALEPPDDQRSMTAGSRATRPIEVAWLSSGVVPAADAVTSRSAPTPTDAEPDDADPVAATSDLATTAIVDDGVSDELVATAPAEGDSTPIPLDDLISNYGCMMVEAEPGEHLGVNCIDDGWLNTDGTVYVHTTVPAAQHVRISSSPPVGETEYGAPNLVSFDADSAPNYTSYEFTSKSFDIVPAETYHLVAMAWDGEGNMAWRYGTATVPYVAHVVIDEITVLNDGDEGSLNRGEIEFRVGVADEQWTFGEDKYDDGDSFDPDVEHVISDAGSTVRIWASATEDDPGKCVVEAVPGDWESYQDGGGCHYARAVELFDLTTGQPSIDVDFTSPDEHLRIRVEGHISVSLP